MCHPVYRLALTCSPTTTAEMSSPEANFLFFSSQYISGARSPLAVATSFLLKSWNLKETSLVNHCQVLRDPNCLLTLTLISTLWTFPRPTGSSRPHLRGHPRGRRCPSRGRLGHPAPSRTDRIFEPLKEWRKIRHSILNKTVLQDASSALGPLK